MLVCYNPQSHLHLPSKSPGRQDALSLTSLLLCYFLPPLPGWVEFLPDVDGEIGHNLSCWVLSWHNPTKTYIWEFEFLEQETSEADIMLPKFIRTDSSIRR